MIQRRSLLKILGPKRRMKTIYSRTKLNVRVFENNLKSQEVCQLISNRKVFILKFVEQKQKEFQEQLEANNSTYKLDEKSAKFYEELRKKAKQKDLKIKQDETRDLHRFQHLRQSRNDKRTVEKDDIKLIKPTMKKRKKEDTDGIHKKDGIVIERETSETTIDDTESPIPTTLGLEGYSSSEDEES